MAGKVFFSVTRKDPTTTSRGRRTSAPAQASWASARVLDRALTRAVRLRNPPVRGRGRGPRRPGAGPRAADAACDPPDLRRPGALTVSTSALPRRGQGYRI